MSKPKRQIPNLFIYVDSCQTLTHMIVNEPQNYVTNLFVLSLVETVHRWGGYFTKIIMRVWSGDLHIEKRVGLVLPCDAIKRLTRCSYLQSL